MSSLPKPLDASFDDPLSMLYACHERVRHFAALTLTLARHLPSHGADESARQAAQQILRYFDQAAPLHHQDEEDDLFPALAPVASATLREAMQRIEAEHIPLAALWQQVRQRLQAVFAGEAQFDLALAEEFAARYPAHAAREEAEIFAFAAQLLSSAQLQQLGLNMAARRQQGARP